MRNLDNQEIGHKLDEILGRFEDLNSRLVNLYNWINTDLRLKIQEYDKENTQQNERLNKLEYEQLTKK